MIERFFFVEAREKPALNGQAGHQPCLLIYMLTSK